MKTYLNRLGVAPVVNCGGVRTFYGNTLALPEVIDAMAEAARCHFVMDELRLSVSKRLGELTGFEAGIVTSGSAGGLFLAAAAAAAGNDPEKMLSLPRIHWPRHQALMPAGHRFSYDQALRLAGLPIVEVDSEQDAAERLGSGEVALVCFLGTCDATGALPFDDIAKLAKSFGVPTVVDAASEFPVRPNPWQQRMADLVVYSTGKFMRGPQATGLLLGRRDLVEAAWRNAAPHQSAGRPLKVGKDQIVGALVAVEEWFAQDRMKSEPARCHEDLLEIARGLEERCPVRTELVEPGSWPVPRLRVSWECITPDHRADTLRLALLAGEPRILLDDIGMTESSLLIDAFGLRPGECEIVVDGISGYFSGIESTGAKKHLSPAAHPGDDLVGDWTVSIDFLGGKEVHRLVVERTATGLAGTHSGLTFTAPLTVTLRPGGVCLESRTPFEGVFIYYRFSGEFVSGRLEGEVVIGAGSKSNSGPVGASQFGRATWRAERDLPE